MQGPVVVAMLLYIFRNPSYIPQCRSVHLHKVLSTLKVFALRLLCRWMWQRVSGMRLALPILIDNGRSLLLNVRIATLRSHLHVWNGYGYTAHVGNVGDTDNKNTVSSDSPLACGGTHYK